ncbi:DUF4376 domain-containing protein [Comamonas testosteroni]|uniref:DUF4376 domain-containing protein n=1 Tax=Comamonas testosteroni TaxID=285 RepID=UPI000682C710|nr:DUF4376 domain-containing protein [Comamonas testosteroni]
MPIIKTISTGNGIAGAAQVELAKLQRHIPGTDLSAPAGLEVQVHLYPTLADARAGTNLLWQLYPALPVTAYDPADPFGSLERALIDAQGDFSGGTFAPEEVVTTLDMAKAVKWAEIKAIRDQLECGGFEVANVGHFDSDAESRARIVGASMAAKIARDAGQPYAINWTLADNRTVELDADAMINVGFALLAHVNGIHQRSRSLYAEIQAAEDAQAVAAISWAGPAPAPEPTPEQDEPVEA